MSAADTNKPDAFAKRAVKNTAAFGIGCALVLVLGEAAVRILDLPPKPLPPLNAQTYQLSTNPVIRFEYRPGYAPEMEAYGPEHEGFRINAAGFRDAEFDTAKPDGVERIVVLGDSITAGNGIQDVADVYSKRLETLMNTGSGTERVQVYNLGVGGYNTLQQVETLRVKGLQYEPDIVVIGFCVNDFSWEASPFVRLMEQLDPEQRELLGGMQWGNRPWVNALMSRSRLAMFTFARIQGLRGEEERAYNLDDYSIKGTDPVSMGLPMLSDLQNEHGFECYLFIIPAFDDEFDRYGYGHIHERVRAAAAPFPNIRVVDLFEDFAKSGKHPSALAFDGLHPTALGHDLLARFMKGHIESPESISVHFPDLDRAIIKNGSFEVVGAGTDAPASWFAAPAGYTPPVRTDPAAPDGDHAVELAGVNQSWTVLAQYLDMLPEDYGKTLVATAYAKTPGARNLFLEIEWRIGEERFVERSPWPASPNAYAPAEVRATIPPAAAAEKSRLKITVRPGSGASYYVDDVRVRIE